MNIMIGIHQQEEKVDKLYQNLGLHAASLVDAGPFPDKNEALAWIEYMRQRNGDCQFIEMPNPENTATPWYGFSFEQ